MLMHNKCLIVVLLFVVSSLAGCDHRKNVLKLIQASHPEVDKFGQMHFSDYEETKKTFRHTRTYSIKGGIFWENDVYCVNEFKQVVEGMLPIVVVDRLTSEKNGDAIATKNIRFNATLYRGDLDKKFFNDYVQLQLPKGKNCYTKEELLKAYSQYVIVDNIGQLVHGSEDVYREYVNGYVKNVDALLNRDTGKRAELDPIFYERVENVDAGTKTIYAFDSSSSDQLSSMSETDLEMYSSRLDVAHREISSMLDEYRQSHSAIQNFNASYAKYNMWSREDTTSLLKEKQDLLTQAIDYWELRVRWIEDRQVVVAGEKQKRKNRDTARLNGITNGAKVVRKIVNSSDKNPQGKPKKIVIIKKTGAKQSH